MKTEQMQAIITAALEDVKVQNLTVLDVRDKTTIADLMLVGSGTSNRHLQALVDRVDEAMSGAGIEPLGREGSPGSDWVLIDYGDVIVHVMLPETRAFYDLEQLWSGASPSQAEASDAARQGPSG
ncbi:MAG: ribosome silencing factor [Natronospirillum sp.]|uniref:ribosome silencing factor n=1 Tax=Natronospirillum sp. TaxID=2812955 RepID=UPI0025D9CAA1|nr:ribosome silencing factor [Natronospirillum sp.]MCH8551066.1 ribosome silencing factor [Natronospirillum sp.]